MKRILAILVTVALVVCGAGQAMAASFDNNNLLMVVYNWTDNEVAIDLGDFMTTDYSTPGQTLAGPGSVNLGQFGSAVANWDDLHVGLFTFAQTATAARFVFGTTQNTAVATNSKTMGNFANGSIPAHGAYQSASGGDQVAVISATNMNSYSKKMDNLAYGQMAGYNVENAAIAGPDLSALLSDGFIDLYLYAYDHTNTLVAGTGVDYQGIIRLNADGSVMTVAGASPVVPIPGALVLFASGLVGLIGIRRRNA